MYNKVISYFQEMAKIPRKSWNEIHVREYMINWAIKNEFRYKIDNYWNLYIYVEWKWKTKNNDWFILQWHLDMVCVDEPWLNYDFEKKWIKVLENEECFYAEWTSLWADNWIWIAMIMCICENIDHPPIEILLTVEEEIWLIWALRVDPELLSYEKMINLDTEDEWEICISCAWWMQYIITSKLKKQKNKYNMHKLTLSGYEWWHSWADINKNRWNPIVDLLSFIRNLDIDYEIWNIDWGIADNSIPTYLSIEIWVENFDLFTNELTILINNLRNKYNNHNINYKIENRTWTYSYWKLDNIISVINNIKTWVIEYSEKIEWLPKYSNNLWIIKVKDNNIEIVFMTRSSDLNLINQHKEEVEKLCKKFNIASNFSEPYPWWEGDKNSKLVKQCEKVMKKYLWDKTKIVAYHAWLECGAIVWKLSKNIDTISIWPDIKEVHSTNEKVYKKSIKNYCEIVLELVNS